jgi:hypothetical protein
MIALIFGLLIIVFGFYLYHVKEGPAAVVGSLFAVVGVLLSVYGLVSFLVPMFFQ